MENCENLRIQVPHDLETFLRGRNGGLFTAGGKMFLTFSENSQKLTPNADHTTGADQTADIGSDVWSGPCLTSSYVKTRCYIVIYDFAGIFQ